MSQLHNFEIYNPTRKNQSDVEESFRRGQRAPMKNLHTELSNLGLDEINEIEILQFERGNTPLLRDHTRGNSEYDAIEKRSPNGKHRNYLLTNHPSPKKNRALDILPDYIDSIGRGLTSLNPQVIQLAREMGGGLISRFAFFQNVFRPDVYDRSEQESNNEISQLDHHAQIAALCTNVGKECYPTLKTSLMEQELQNFSKQIIASLNTVLYKSQTSQIASWPHMASSLPMQDLQTIMSIADPCTSTLSHNSSLGNKPLSSPSNNLTVDKSGLYKRIGVLQEEIQAMKQATLEREALFNKARKDYTRDLQNLRNALFLCNNPINWQHAESVKLAINVYNFNDLEGLTPEVVDLFNEKIQIVKEEAQMQIDKITQNVTHLIDRIDKYKNLKPEHYGLMEMELKEIFEGIAIIEPLAFPIWQTLMKAYPPSHFSAIIKQIAESLTDDNDDTYDKLINMVQAGIDQNTKQCERALDLVRGRNKVYQEEITDLKREQNANEWRLKEMLNKQEQSLRETHQENLRTEIDKLSKQHSIEKKKFDNNLKMKKEEMVRLKRSKEQTDIKIAVFKWKQSGIMCRFMQELSAESLDKHSLRDLMLEDMRKLFFSQEIQHLMNSLKQSKQMNKSSDGQLKVMQSENYQLRLKVNRLLTENQTQNMQLESLLCRETEFTNIIDIEKKKQYEAQLRESRLKDKADNLSHILSWQIKLKEGFEDKLKDTLDMNKSSAISTSNADRSRQNLRQKQTKRVIHGFQIEMECLLITNQQAVDRLTDTAFDVNYGQQKIDIGSQTDVQGTHKNMQLVDIYEKPVNVQSTAPIKNDQEMQTSVTGTVVDYLANSSRKYDHLVKHGMIRGSAHQYQSDDQDESANKSYVQRLHSQEQNDGIISIQRRATSKVPTSTYVSPESSVDRSGRSPKGRSQPQRGVQNVQSQRVVSPKSANSSKNAQNRQTIGNKKYETAADAFMPQRPLHKLEDSTITGFDSREEVKEEDSVASSGQQMRKKNQNQGNRNNREREHKTKISSKSRVNENTKGAKHTSIPMISKNQQLTDQDLVEDDYSKRMKPKLNKRHRNHWNADLSSSTNELDQSSSGRTSDSQSAEDSAEPQVMGLTSTERNTVDLNQPQTAVHHAPQYIDMNYRAMVERKNAVSQFEAYLQVFQLMTKMEPKLFKTAVQSIKKHRSFKLDLPTLKRLKKLCPDLLPPVFQRLLQNEPDGKERLLLRSIFIDARQNWQNTLSDRGLVVDETALLPSTANITSNMSPIGIHALDELKATGNSESQITQNTSMPYLSPVNFTKSDSNSLLSQRQPKQNVEIIPNQSQQQHKLVQQPPQPPQQIQQPQKSVSPRPKPRKIIDRESSAPQEKSEMSSETTNNDEDTTPAAGKQNAMSAHQMTQGFYSLPNSAYEMRVSIMLPKKRKSGSRSSMQVGRSRKSRMARQLATENQSWHLMVGKNKSCSSTKPSKMPDNANTCMSQSQRLGRNTNESGVFNRTSILGLHSALSNQEGDVVIMEAPENLPMTSGSHTLALNSLVAELNVTKDMTDYEGAAQFNTLQIGERNLPSQIQLTQRILKRPATCRPGAANKQNSRTVRNALHNSTASKQSISGGSSQMQFLFKKGMANSNTMAQTIATTRAQSHMENIHPNGKVTAMSNNFDKRHVSTSQGLSNLMIDKSINSLSNPKNQQRGAKAGACPVRAFDMSNIPISPNDWQQKHRLSKVNSPLSTNFVGKTALRAQSATQNRTRRSLKKTSSAHGNIQAALNAMALGNSKQRAPINKVAVMVDQRINVNSEEEFEHLNNENVQYVDVEGHTTTLLQSNIAEQGRVSQVTMHRESEMECIKGRESGRHTPADQVAPEQDDHRPPQKKPSLIRVSDQLEKYSHGGRQTHQQQYENRL